MSQGYFGKREKLYLNDLHRALINATHILHSKGILDASSHISSRNPDAPNASFLMPRASAPAVLSKASDIIEYDIKDAEPVEKDAAQGFDERLVHAEVYQKFPNVNAVCLAHGAGEVIPFPITGVPLRPSSQQSAFLGNGGPPVWDGASSIASSDPHDLLVRGQKSAHALAAAFRPETSAGFLASKFRSALPTQIGGTGNTEPGPTDPTHPVVLIRGNGFATCAASIEQLVYQAIYTVEAAKAQMDTLLLQGAYFNATLEGKVNVDGGGKISSGKVKSEAKEAKYLSDREADDAWAKSSQIVLREWEGWCREVEVNPLYECEVESGDE